MEVVSHDAKPVPANLEAWVQDMCKFVTFATFHPLRSEFIAAASVKVFWREVRAVVFHLLKSEPTYVAAFGLPPLTYEPPVGFRFLEKAWLKSATSLTSQSLMSPHLAVAVAVSWTQSVDGR